MPVSYWMQNNGICQSAPSLREPSFWPPCRGRTISRTDSRTTQDDDQCWRQAVIVRPTVALFRQEDIKDITVIRGFGKEHVHADTVEFVDNDQFATTGELFTLDKGYHVLAGETAIAYGDIVFRKYILQMLLDAPEDIAIAVDSSWRQRPSFNGLEDFVTVTSSGTPNSVAQKHWLKHMDPSLEQAGVDGEWIGLLHATATGTQAIKRAMDELRNTS